MKVEDEFRMQYREEQQQKKTRFFLYKEEEGKEEDNEDDEDDHDSPLPGAKRQCLLPPLARTRIKLEEDAGDRSSSSSRIFIAVLTNRHLMNSIFGFSDGFTVDDASTFVRLDKAGSFPNDIFLTPLLQRAATHLQFSAVALKTIYEDALKSGSRGVMRWAVAESPGGGGGYKPEFSFGLFEKLLDGGVREPRLLIDYVLDCDFQRWQEMDHVEQTTTVWNESNVLPLHHHVAADICDFDHRFINILPLLQKGFCPTSSPEGKAIILLMAEIYDFEGTNRDRGVCLEKTLRRFLRGREAAILLPLARSNLSMLVYIWRTVFKDFDLLTDDDVDKDAETSGSQRSDALREGGPAFDWERKTIMRSIVRTIFTSASQNTSWDRSAFAEWQELLSAKWFLLPETRTTDVSSHLTSTSLPRYPAFVLSHDRSDILSANLMTAATYRVSLEAAIAAEATKCIQLLFEQRTPGLSRRIMSIPFGENTQAFKKLETYRFLLETYPQRTGMQAFELTEDAIDQCIEASAGLETIKYLWEHHNGPAHCSRNVLVTAFRRSPPIFAYLQQQGLQLTDELSQIIFTTSFGGGNGSSGSGFYKRLGKKKDDEDSFYSAPAFPIANAKAVRQIGKQQPSKELYRAACESVDYLPYLERFFALWGTPSDEILSSCVCASARRSQPSTASDAKVMFLCGLMSPAAIGNLFQIADFVNLAVASDVCADMLLERSKQPFPTEEFKSVMKEKNWKENGDDKLSAKLLQKWKEEGDGTWEAFVLPQSSRFLEILETFEVQWPLDNFIRMYWWCVNNKTVGEGGRFYNEGDNETRVQRGEDFLLSVVYRELWKIRSGCVDSAALRETGDFVTFLILCRAREGVIRRACAGADAEELKRAGLLHPTLTPEVIEERLRACESCNLSADLKALITREDGL